MMKIKNLFYLALLPLSVAGAVFSYKFISKRLIRGRRVRNAGLLSKRDTYILEILEIISARDEIIAKFNSHLK